MTCIVGLQQAGKVYMGADSCAGLGDSSSDLLPEQFGKICILSAGKKKERIIVGLAGNGGLLSVIRFSFDVPDLPTKGTSEATMKWLAKEYAPALWKAADKARIVEAAKGGRPSTAAFQLIGVRGTLYGMTPALSPYMLREPFSAIGSGFGPALGVMHVTSDLDPRERIRKALEASERYTDNVRGPFVISFV